MKKKSIIAAAICAASPLAVHPAYAQETQAAVEQDTHTALFDAMESGVDRDQVMEIALEAIVGQMVQAQPQFSALEQDKPGFLAALKDALRGPIRQYSDRVQIEYRPRMIEVVREVFTAEEAMALATFYHSETGQRMLQSASGNFSVDNVVRAGVAGETPTADAVTADLNATGQRALAALSEDDQAAVFAAAITTPGFRKMPAFQQGIAPIRAEMEAAPPTAEENTAIIEAVTGVMQRYVN